MGRGGEEHDAADATMADNIGHRFTGKVAIVTGAASGIGRATAQRLVLEGAVVAGLDIDEEGLDETVRLIDRGAVEETPAASRADRAAERWPTAATSRPRSR